MTLRRQSRFTALVLAATASAALAGCGDDGDNALAGGTTPAAVDAAADGSAAGNAGAEAVPPANPGTAGNPGQPANPAQPARPAQPANPAQPPRPGAAEPPVKAPAAEPQVKAPAAAPPVKLPAGQVPRFLAGQWSGGEGDRTGEFLKIAANGSFQRGKNGNAPYEQGVIVAGGGGETVFHLTSGARKNASFEYTDAGGGIEVLSFSFADGSYYSYARA